WTLSLSRRARAPDVAGSPAEGLPGDLARESLPGARDVGTAGAEPRSAVCHAERTGRADARQAAAALLRPPRVRPTSAVETLTNADGPAPPCACSRRRGQIDRTRRS